MAISLLPTALAVLALILPIPAAAVEGRDPERPWGEYNPPTSISSSSVWPSSTRSDPQTSTVSATRPGWSATCSQTTCVPFTSTVTVSTCGSATPTTKQTSSTCPPVSTITVTETSTTVEVETTTVTSVSISISTTTETVTTTTTAPPLPTSNEFYIVSRNSPDVPDGTPMHFENRGSTPVGPIWAAVFSNSQPGRLFTIDACDGGRLVDVQDGLIAHTDPGFLNGWALQFVSQAEIERREGLGSPYDVCRCSRGNPLVPSELSCNCGGRVVDFMGAYFDRDWLVATTEGEVPDGSETFTPFAVPGPPPVRRR